MDVLADMQRLLVTPAVIAPRQKQKHLLGCTKEALHAIFSSRVKVPLHRDSLLNCLLGLSKALLVHLRVAVSVHWGNSFGVIMLWYTRYLAGT